MEQFGALCVTTPGISWMPMLSADNWDLQVLVCNIAIYFAYTVGVCSGAEVAMQNVYLYTLFWSIFL